MSIYPLRTEDLCEDTPRLLGDSQTDGDMDYPDQYVERVPMAVHQCSICNKVFVNFKGLQQHSVIHSDEKPFQCDICGKRFRFKSNLFEHRSVHSGFTPHSCPYCGKTTRLKGNLKKHLKTHVSTREELEDAWRPFSSNRRPPSEIPDDAIIVRGTGEPFFQAPSKRRAKKLGLGDSPRRWIDKIRNGDIMATMPINEKTRRLEALMQTADEQGITDVDIFEHAKAIAFEKFDCPMCKSMFMSLRECIEHLEIVHPMAKVDRPYFCETCMKAFADSKSMEQHMSYHKRVDLLIKMREIDIPEPEVLLPMGPDEDEEETSTDLSQNTVPLVPCSPRKRPFPIQTEVIKEQRKKEMPMPIVTVSVSTLEDFPSSTIPGVARIIPTRTIHMKADNVIAQGDGHADKCTESASAADVRSFFDRVLAMTAQNNNGADVGQNGQRSLAQTSPQVFSIPDHDSYFDVHVRRQHVPSDDLQIVENSASVSEPTNCTEIRTVQASDVQKFDPDDE